MTADAFNNLSDAGSSVITLLGFRMAAKKPDPGHPFGHGRIEYLSGVAVSLIIIVVGVQLGLESIDKIRSPEPVDAGLLPMLVLVASICVKGYMFAYNRGIGRKLNSPGMSATAMDSLSDCIATGVVAGLDAAGALHGRERRRLGRRGGGLLHHLFRLQGRAGDAQPPAGQSARPPAGARTSWTS